MDHVLENLQRAVDLSSPTVRAAVQHSKEMPEKVCTYACLNMALEHVQRVVDLSSLALQAKQSG
jgi:hypothetical protein